MEGIREQLEELGEAIAAAIDCDALRRSTDAGLVGLIPVIEGLGRRVDALRIAAAGEVDARSAGASDEGIAADHGCRTAVELVERLTLVSSRTARQRIRLAKATRCGAGAPVEFPLVAAALDAGEIGVDAAETITSVLKPAIHEADRASIGLAEEALVQSALGTAPETPLPCAADYLTTMAYTWLAHLAPSGSAPDETRAALRRGVRLGRERDGLTPISGALLPEVAGGLARLFDAVLSPRARQTFADEPDAGRDTGPSGPLPDDERTPDQKRHDAFASIVGVAARAKELPVIGGLPPTPLVSVRAEDLAAGTGVGWMDGVDAPLSLRSVEQMICNGGLQRVIFDPFGRIIELGSPERCFTPQQRRAITLRDGGCIIPGCGIPASWTEIHHVVDHVKDGETHPDNGVLLCWFHHRTLHKSGWEVGMSAGVPQVRPPVWIDHRREWHPVTKSKTALTRQLGPPGRERPPGDAAPTHRVA